MFCLYKQLYVIKEVTWLSLPLVSACQMSRLCKHKKTTTKFTPPKFFMKIHPHTDKKLVEFQSLCIFIHPGCNSI